MTLTSIFNIRLAEVQARWNFQRQFLAPATHHGSAVSLEVGSIQLKSSGRSPKQKKVMYAEWHESKQVALAFGRSKYRKES